MSQIKTLNGVQYTLPQYNDTNWGANTGQVLTQYIAAIADCTLQLTGGAFTLTADADFGANFGLKALYVKSETANIATSGVMRLASADTIGWRNNANNGNVALSKDASDNLLWSGTKVTLSGAIVNADIASGAAIAYSKLSLTGSILNADLAGSIAYSKLSLTGAILNADLAGSIAYSKLSLTGAILNADLAGSIAYSKLTLTGAILNADLAGSIAYSKLSLTGSIVNGDLAGAVSIAKGGTNSTTALNNGHVIVSSAGSLIEQAGSASDAANVQLLGLFGGQGAPAALRIDTQSTTGINSTTATAIFSPPYECCLVLVSGNNSTNYWAELVMCGFSATTPTTGMVLSDFGTPPARTYTMVSNVLNVKLASGSAYNVRAVALSVNSR